MPDLQSYDQPDSKPADLPVDPASRLRSLDALRGFDMFWIAGGDVLATKILSRFTSPTAVSLKDQFEHVEWEGFRFYDLIFPLFLFLVGCVIPFSLEKFRERPALAYARILKRTALLFLLGVICNGLLKFDFANLRYAGVLQRIALCYGIAAVLFLNLKLRGQVVAIVSILLGYWAVLALVSVPGGSAGDFTQAGNLCGYIDRNYLPGKIMDEYYGFGDNEGLLSTIPAIATVLLGALAGQWLKSARTGWTKSAGLLVSGILCVAVGILWGLKFPIIKNLWTSSFVLLAGGWSLLLLCLFYTLIDVLRWQKWSFVWTVIGMNAITIFIVPRFIDFSKMATFFLSGLAELSGDWSSVVLVAGSLLAKWLFLYYLYRNKIFLRL